METFIGITITAVLARIIFRNLPTCPDCGIWIACDKCSAEMDKIDEDLDR